MQYQADGSGIVTLRPMGDLQNLGSYSICCMTGTMAAGLAAGSPVLSFRWGDASRLCLVRRVTAAANSLGTGFAAGVGTMDIVGASGFTAPDTGGAKISLGAGMNNRRASSGGTLVEDLRIATTATLTAGTRTLDAYAFRSLTFGVDTSTNKVQLATSDLWYPDAAGEWPLILAKDEGFIVRATVPATGTWSGTICVEWAEVASI
jgi:hypothetical protein